MRVDAPVTRLSRNVDVPLTLREVHALLDMVRVMRNTLLLDERQEDLAVQIQRKLRRFA